MTAFRRGALGLLTVLLLAATAAGIGYAMRQPTGPDIGAPAVEASPSPVANRPAATPTPTPAPTVEPTAVPAVEPVAEPAAPQAPDRAAEAGKRLLGPGDEGDEVRDLQARLRALAWFFDDVDGTYADSTAEAVRGFQAKRAIAVTGVVDRRTLDRLHAMTGTPTRDELGLHNVPGPLDARCATGRVLCVDKTTQTLRWVVDGQVLKTVDVRFGSEYTPTREGAFAVQSKSRDHVSSLYDTAMPYAMFFSGGQAVHYSSDFAAVGYAGASHGCVNVRDEDAVAWLFDHVEVGDEVVVYRS